MPKHERKYNRILLKLSGEALTGDADFGIDPKVLDRMAVEVGQLVGLGVQIGMVIGGGNLFRGAALHSAGMERVTGDHMGMLATVMNALAMRDALERASIPTRVMMAFGTQNNTSICSIVGNGIQHRARASSFRVRPENARVENLKTWSDIFGSGNYVGAADVCTL